MSKFEIIRGQLMVYNRTMNDLDFQELENKLRLILTLDDEEKQGALNKMQSEIQQKEASIQSVLFRSYNLSNIPEVWVHPAEDWDSERKISDLIGIRPELVKDGFFMLFINRVFTGDFVMDGKLHLLTKMDLNREKLNDLCHEVAYGEKLFDES